MDFARGNSLDPVSQTSFAAIHLSHFTPHRHCRTFIFDLYFRPSSMVIDIRENKLRLVHRYVGRKLVPCHSCKGLRVTLEKDKTGPTGGGDSTLGASIASWGPVDIHVCSPRLFHVKLFIGRL